MTQAIRDTIDQELQRGDQRSMIALIDAFIGYAHATRASDIHINADEETVRIRFRIDGVLHDRYTLPKHLLSEIIARIKILSRLRTDEHQASQDGRFRLAIPGTDTLDVRVSIVPTYYGESAVLRILAHHAEQFTLDTLGFSSANREKILQAIEKPHGMILATGPTGSGKTTTLYGILKALNTPERSIITIEDPIEYAVDNIKQIPVNDRVGLSFANGLRSILRQDPNIIMVGEIRDHETAGLAINTALTGHLLLSTLHTNDAATTLPRLLDMNIASYLVASTVNVAIAQRLVRKICTTCHNEPHLTLHCAMCTHSGYYGRVGIHEVLVVDDTVREAILAKAPASEIKKIAISQGMTPMIEDGLDKAAQGITSLQEVLRVTHE